LTVQEKYLNDVLIKIERNLHFSAEEKSQKLNENLILLPQGFSKPLVSNTPNLELEQQKNNNQKDNQEIEKKKEKEVKNDCNLKDQTVINESKGKSKLENMNIILKKNLSKLEIHNIQF